MESTEEPEPMCLDDMQVPFDPSIYHEELQRFLAEDLGTGDITTTLLVSRGRRARGTLLAKGQMVLAGVDLFAEVAPVIAAAADAHRVFFQVAQARRRLARIHDADARPCDGAHILPRYGSNPRQPLQEVEGHTLASEKWAGEAGNPFSNVAVAEFLAVPAASLDIDGWIQETEHLGE